MHSKILKILILWKLSIALGQHLGRDLGSWFQILWGLSHFPLWLVTRWNPDLWYYKIQNLNNKIFKIKNWLQSVSICNVMWYKSVRIKIIDADYLRIWCYLRNIKYWRIINIHKCYTLCNNSRIKSTCNSSKLKKIPHRVRICNYNIIVRFIWRSEKIFIAKIENFKFWGWLILFYDFDDVIYLYRTFWWWVCCI